MQYCEKCKVTIKTQNECCPLCHGTLIGEADASDDVMLFPKLREKGEKDKLFLKTFSFTCVCVAIIVFIVNRTASPDKWWSLYVIGILFYAWVITQFAVLKKHNIMKNIIWQELIIVLGLIMWDVATGYSGWSIEFGFPIAVSAGFVLSVINKIIRKLPEEEYIIYYFINILILFVFGILALCNVFNVVLPSVLGFGMAFIILAYLVIFKRRAFIEELKKNFFV